MKNSVLRKVLHSHHLPLLLLGLVLLYNIPLLMMRGIALGGDGLLLFYPAEHALAQALRRWTLPFWVPELQSGFPLLADGQPGCLYPLNLLALGLLPTPLAHNLLLVIHSVLGFSFTLYWARFLGLSSSAAAIAGFVFVMSTPLTGGNVPMVEALTWTPLAFLLTERLVRGTSLRAALWLAIVCALQWLAGFPQITVYTLIAAGSYILVHLFFCDLPWKSRLARFGIWCIAVFLGSLLAAPQIFATYELSQYSIRAAGIQGSMSAEGSLFPPALVTFVLPSWRQPFSAAGLGVGAYIGILPVLLSIPAWLIKPRPVWLRALLVTSVLAAVLALGRYQPLFSLLQRLPGLGHFRISSRFLIVVQLGLAISAGRGWDLLHDPTTACDRAPRWIRRVLGVAAGLLMVNVLAGTTLLTALRPNLLRVMSDVAERVLSDPYHVQPSAYYNAKVSLLYTQLLEATSWRNILVAVPLCSVAVAWLTLSWRPRFRRLIWLSFIVLDLFAFSGWVRPTVPVEWVTHPPGSVGAVKQIAPQDPYRIFWLADQASVTSHNREALTLLPANYNLLFGLSSTGLYSPLGFHDYYTLMRDLSTVNLAFGMRPIEPDAINTHQALLDFLNVRFILSHMPLERLQYLTYTEGVYVYPNPQALTRAFLVDQVQVILSEQEALAWTLEHLDQLHTVAVVDSPLSMALGSDAATASEVSISTYASQTVALNVSAVDTVLLVLTDTYYPGWHVTIDGTPASLYRANALFRGVIVPPGDHYVRFSYTPGAFRHGIWVAFCGACGLVAWAIIGRWRCRGSS